MENTELKKYFDRIHYSKNAELTIETLKDIHALQPQYITFENIDTYTDHVPRVDWRSVFNKLVIGGRGGYCYEQNVLLKNVLETIGFAVTSHLGRVLWGGEKENKPPRTHMLLIVSLDEKKYLVDSGFGTVTLTSPLVLDSEEEQITPNGIFKLSKENNLYTLTLIAEDKMPIYEFSLEPVEQSDVVVANWYIATNPSSIFRENLIVTKVDGIARYTLNNTSLHMRYNNGVRENIDINNPEELFILLENVFNINIKNIDDKELLMKKIIKKCRLK
ncbi:arylamine N-acetyltransferase [Chryseobacterium sp. T16E-39]|uniref:arylamine N-acetyltransferase family protein n=1 Tax=Chryseobacterium sp. T16E-39 TaxID=2015076 RepID=UPI000B5B1D3D|nr:arylamine N-acetyltransferase [Chryseobacterium sp. T16E-39]ASK32086.1 arylamine N-acetyltransferase [Chryseobacterium sp. T16E-39]